VVAIGINALGYLKVLGIAVGDSEAEGFWRQFFGSLKVRGLDGTRLVISDAHLGLTAAIKGMFQGCCWQRCRVHFLHFPQEHWRKIWSTNPLERLNKEIKRRTNVVGIFPNDAAITRLVGSQRLEQQEEWQLERRRFFSEATMARIPAPEEPFELIAGQLAEKAEAAIS